MAWAQRFLFLVGLGMLGEGKGDLQRLQQCHPPLSNSPLFQFCWEATINEQFYMQLITNGTDIGWMAFGLSAFGSMVTSDIVVVEQAGNTWTATDYHAWSQGPPQQDTVQDWEVVSSGEFNGVKNVIVRRPVSTFDSQDMPFMRSTQYFIAAFGAGRKLAKHHVTRRFSGGVNFFAQEAAYVSFQETTGSVDLVIPHVDFDLTNGNDVHYFCPFFTVNDTLGIASWSGIPHNSHLLHHAWIYECPAEILFHPLLFPGGAQRQGTREVHGVQITDYQTLDCRDRIMMCSSVVEWVKGTERRTVDGVVAVLKPGFAYFMEAHFEPHRNTFADNNGLGLGVVSSGLMRGGTLQESGAALVSPFFPTIRIPAHADKYALTIVLTSECTQARLPTDGVTIYSYRIHGHYSVNGGYVDHHRSLNGKLRFHQRVLDVPSFDMWLGSPNLRPFRLYPGDALRTTIYYTNPSDEAKVGRLTLDGEMAMLIFSYYPAVPDFNWVGHDAIYQDGDIGVQPEAACGLARYVPPGTDIQAMTMHDARSWDGFEHVSTQESATPLVAAPAWLPLAGMGTSGDVVNGASGDVVNGASGDAVNGASGDAVNAVNVWLLGSVFASAWRWRS